MLNDASLADKMRCFVVEFCQVAQVIHLYAHEKSVINLVRSSCLCHMISMSLADANCSDDKTCHIRVKAVLGTT